MGQGDFCSGRNQTCSLFLFLNTGLRAKNCRAVPGFIFFSEKAFQWQSSCIYFFLLIFVATSDGNLYPHASHLKYINVGESVGFQMSSTLTPRIKHFSLCSSLSPSLQEGQNAACCRHYQPCLCLFSGLLQTAPSQHKQIIIKFSSSHPTPASPRGGKKQSLSIFR